MFEYLCFLRPIENIWLLIFFHWALTPKTTKHVKEICFLWLCSHCLWYIGRPLICWGGAKYGSAFSILWTCNVKYFNELLHFLFVTVGDARNDSPGFSAQYCTYTLLDHTTKDIVAVEFCDKREAGDKSPNMEPFALVRALEAVKAKQVKVSELVTDAHPTISALLSKHFLT